MGDGRWEMGEGGISTLGMGWERKAGFVGLRIYEWDNCCDSMNPVVHSGRASLPYVT